MAKCVNIVSTRDGRLSLEDLRLSRRTNTVIFPIDESTISMLKMSIFTWWRLFWNKNNFIQRKIQSSYSVWMEFFKERKSTCRQLLIADVHHWIPYPMAFLWSYYRSKAIVLWSYDLKMCYPPYRILMSLSYRILPNRCSFRPLKRINIKFSIVA